MKNTILTSALFILTSLSGIAISHAQTTTVTFESLPVPAEGFFNGDTNGSSPYRDNFQIIGTRDNFGSPETLQAWDIDGVEFFNGHTEAFGSWNGWSWSNIIDTTTPGYPNQYASFPGGGSDGTGGTTDGDTYAVGFGNDTYINLPSDIELNSIDITTTTYSALSMRDGDSFTEKFGGASGDDPDYLKVTLTGYDEWFVGVDQTGSAIGSVEVYLADYRFSDNSLDFILDEWLETDLSPIVNARSIGFSFESTDFAIPTYLAIDNLSFSATSVPEPGTILLTGLTLLGIALRRRR